MESTASDIQFPLSVTGSHMKPVRALEKLNLAR